MFSHLVKLCRLRCLAFTFRPIFSSMPNYPSASGWSTYACNLADTFVDQLLRLDARHITVERLLSRTVGIVQLLNNVFRATWDPSLLSAPTIWPPQEPDAPQLDCLDCILELHRLIALPSLWIWCMQLEHGQHVSRWSRSAAAHCLSVFDAIETEYRNVEQPLIHPPIASMLWPVAADVRLSAMAIGSLALSTSAASAPRLDRLRRLLRTHEGPDHTNVDQEELPVWTSDADRRDLDVAYERMASVTGEMQAFARRGQWFSTRKQRPDVALSRPVGHTQGMHCVLHLS